jgi:ATP-dependent Clp protease ATP-binding subunit ClpC
MDKRPYTTRAQMALALANAAAAQLGDEFVGTEHVLIGLLDEETGPAAKMLGHLGVTSVRIRDLLLDMRSNRSS